MVGALKEYAERALVFEAIGHSLVHFRDGKGVARVLVGDLVRETSANGCGLLGRDKAEERGRSVILCDAGSRLRRQVSEHRIELPVELGVFLESVNPFLAGVVD